MIAEQMLAGKLELDDRESEMVTSEAMHIIDYADVLGITDDMVLDTVTSAQWARRRAKAVVEAAQSRALKLISSKPG